MSFSHMQNTWKNISKDNSSTMHSQQQDFLSYFKSLRFKYTRFSGITSNEQTPSRTGVKREIITTLPVSHRIDLLSLKFYSSSSIWHWQSLTNGINCITPQNISREPLFLSFITLDFWLKRSQAIQVPKVNSALILWCNLSSSHKKAPTNR